MTQEKQKTAVDLIIDRIDELLLIQFDDSDEPKILEELKKYCINTKELEKQQMIDFGFNTYYFISGIMKVPFNQMSENRLNAEHNFNETFE